MLTNREFIPIAAPDSINIFRDEDGGVYYKDDTGKVHVTLSYHDVYKIENPKFKYYNVLSDEKISVLKSSEKDFIFALYRVGAVVGGMGGNGGGGRGRRGIIVQDEGTQVNGIVNTLNFAGASVIVTDDGGGKVTVTIGGGGMITGGGTVNRIAMFTPVGTAIGDSPLLRSGSDVIADGNLYFASGNGIDVVATGGSDVLSIGVNNADVINYGYSGTTHNFSGTTFNEFTTNLNVKDKLITINVGGAAGSGGNAGFEIEEGGSITGYFIQNTARTGFDFQASGVTGVATFNLSNLTGNQTASLQDASGTIAYLSDIPVVTGFYSNGGNAFGGNATIGLTDNFNWSFLTNNIVRGLIDNAGLWAIGSSATTTSTRLAITSTGTTTGFIAQLFNSTPTLMFAVRDDGYISAGVSGGSMTIGLGSAFNSALLNTFIGVGMASTLTTGTFNTGVGSNVFLHLTSGTENTAIGDGAFQTLNTGNYNTGLGRNALASISNNIENTAVGRQALYLCGSNSNTAIGYNAGTATTSGAENTYVGSNAGGANSTGARNVVVGQNASSSNVGSDNTFVGWRSGFSGTTLASSIFIGHESGYWETTNDKLFIDNRMRTNEQDGRNKALIYGKYDNATANQFVVLNGVLYMQDTAAPNHYWSIVNTAGAFVFTDTGSANAPA